MYGDSIQEGITMVSMLKGDEATLYTETITDAGMNVFSYSTLYVSCKILFLLKTLIIMKLSSVRTGGCCVSLACTHKKKKLLG